MLIYAPVITPRLFYITRFIFETITPASIELTTDAAVFKKYTGAKILYAPEQFDHDAYWVMPVNLLFEEGIRQQVITNGIVNDRQVFFTTGGDAGFDIFAASFYLISRYEEYLPYEPDSYGRYAHQNSLAFKAGSLKIPLINFWIADLKKSLQQKFTNTTWKTTSFKYIPTYDIDMAWQYRHKNFVLQVGGMLKDLVTFNFHNVQKRLHVLLRKHQDPFDTYEWLYNLHSEYELNPVYFFLLAAKRGEYDKNIYPGNKNLQTLIKEHGNKYEIGIHPSWQSGDKPSLLRQELKSLTQITGNPITHSRQHYIRFELPVTYRQLIDAGIKYDWSMGYGSINGFRASVAHPFFWYDLEQEQQTDLVIHPFCFMDANAFYEEKLTASEALLDMQKMANAIKASGGTMITIWHNNFLGQHPTFLEWKQVYQQWISELHFTPKPT